jgi:DNA-binding transcriptional LysR family regulator
VSRLRRSRRRCGTLFHRHARGLILTERAGSDLPCANIRQAGDHRALLTKSKEKPAGRLGVTTTVAWVRSGWRRGCCFLRMYPDVSLPPAGRSELDLAMREADVAIRMHPPKQPDLVQRRLLRCTFPICVTEY